MSGRLRRALADTAGLGAVEFAIVFPAVLMILLALGHLGEVLMAEARVERAARNLADAAALMESISDSQMAALLAGAGAVVAPTEGARAATLSSVRPTDGSFVVRWSDGDGAPAPGTVVELDAAAMAAYGALDGNVLVGEVRLAYVSRFAAVWNALPFVPEPLTLTTPLAGRAYALPAIVAGSPPTIVATTRLSAGGAVQ